MRFIILPQAIRTVLPALGNEFATLIKDSSLASVIGVQELAFEGNVIKNATYDVISAFVAIGFIYLIVTSVVALFVHFLEKRWGYVTS